MVEAIEATVANATETNEKAVIQVLVEVPEDLAEAIEVDPTEAEEGEEERTKGPRRAAGAYF